jgi:hypothetical protein
MRTDDKLDRLLARQAESVQYGRWKDVKVIARALEQWADAQIAEREVTQAQFDAGEALDKALDDTHASAATSSPPNPPPKRQTPVALRGDAPTPGDPFPKS